VFTNLRAGHGVEAIVDFIEAKGGLKNYPTAASQPAAVGRPVNRDVCLQHGGKLTSPAALH
jgi:hypothetical protein